MEQVIDYLRLHLAGDEHAAMMMVVEQLRAETTRAEKAELDYRGVVENFDLDSLNKSINDARARVTKLEADLERERMRLAACGVVARANLPATAKTTREMHADYRSASCDDVARAVDREMALRAEKEQEWREHLTEKAALVSEVAALRAEREALFGVELFVRAFVEAEVLVSGYVRLNGHVMHIREAHVLARWAVQALAEAAK